MNKTIVIALSAAVLLGGLGWGLRFSGTGRVPEKVMHADEVASATRKAESRRETNSRAGVRPTAYDIPSEPVASEPSLPLKPPASTTAAASASSPSDEVVWELDPGIRVPAALAEPEASLPPAMAAANERIAQEFEQTINRAQSPAADGAASVSEEVWSEALERADHQYRALNGDAAYGRQTTKSALEARAAADPKAP